jgi:5,10-methylenetetrahydromethanopterin reductase
MEFGIGLLGDLSSARIVDLSQRIEGYGLDQIWVADERFYRDVFVNMTLVACHTRRVRIGALVTDPYIRHPAVTAAAAASIDEVSGGRVVLGLGAGLSGFKQLGIERIRPARAMREAIQLMNRLTSGERNVTFDGELVHFRAGHLNFTPVRRVPIVVAGRGPRVLEVAGELADGVVIGSFASDRGLHHAEQGARRTGRSLADLATISWLYTAIGNDQEEVRAAVRKGVAVAMWGSREILPELGVTLPEEITRFMTEHAYSAADQVISEVARCIPDRLLDEFSVRGTVEEVAGHLVRIGRLGIGQAALGLFPPRGDDLDGQLRLFGGGGRSPRPGGSGRRLGSNGTPAFPLCRTNSHPCCLNGAQSPR